ncbi:MAG: hypothetical protein VX038_02220 [Verrucomicrobiota bacterium]|nr:hypothetical protein [Verrucomicrobiota bacterium]
MSFNFDLHFANPEFNLGFFEDDSPLTPDQDLIEHSLNGVTFGLGLAVNPNLDIKIPFSASRFEVGNLDDTGFVSGIELFPNLRINECVV